MILGEGLTSERDCQCPTGDVHRLDLLPPKSSGVVSSGPQNNSSKLKSLVRISRPYDGT